MDKAGMAPLARHRLRSGENMDKNRKRKKK